MYGHRLIRELLGLLFLFCGLLMLLSLWSYDISDPTFNHAVATKLPLIHNAAGLFGAYLAGFLVDSCGLGSFLWIIFFLAIGAGLVSRWIVIKWYRWIGYILLFACFITFSSAIDLTWRGIHGGGFIGNNLSAFSYVFFSPAGSLLVWGFLFLIAMELSFSISWLALLCAMFSVAAKLFPSLASSGLPRPASLDKLKKFSLSTLLTSKAQQDTQAPPAEQFDILKSVQESMPSEAAETEVDTQLAAAKENDKAPEEDEDFARMLSLIETPGATADDSTPQPSYPTSIPQNAEQPSSSSSLLSMSEESVPGQTSPTSSEDIPADSPILLDMPKNDSSSTEQSAGPSESCTEASTSNESKDDILSFEFTPIEDTPPVPQNVNSSEEQNGAILQPETPAETACQASNASGPESSQCGSNANAILQVAKAAPDIESNPHDSIPSSGPSADTEGLGSCQDMQMLDFQVSETQEEKPSSQAYGKPQQELPELPLSLNEQATEQPAISLRPAGIPAIPPSREVTDAAPSLLPSAEDSEADSEYASVGRAVTAAMSRQAELEAAPESAQEQAQLPRPALRPRRQYLMPKTELLDPVPEADLRSRPDGYLLAQQGKAVITCLKNFNVHAELARITPGPVVTMFEVRPAPGVKATRITNLANDLAMSLKAVAVRMQAPVPGTDTVGIEVPNEKRVTVYFREIIEHESFTSAKSLLNIALGKDISGVPVSADLAKMPHLLVAGATGKGKSVCLNSILISLLFRARPDEMKLILVDPKRVEFSMYADLPHLVHPVVTDMDFTKNALLWAVDEMMRRLDVFSHAKVRNITGYNDRIRELRSQVEAGGPIPRDADGREEDLEPMPFLIIVIDELADLMQMKRKEVEGPIIRLAQMGRAAGLHLIIATQRPSVDVVTGLIKANFPCRIAFQVTNGQDSRTILDTVGAEKLLGMGDMLFKPNGDNIRRLHGAFVSDHDVAEVVGFWKRQQKPDYQVDFSKFGDEEEDAPESLEAAPSRGNDIVDDPLYAEATQFVYETGKVSISLLQRRFRIGFNRAARFFEQMEKDGIVGQADGGGAKPRSVIHR